MNRRLDALGQLALLEDVELLLMALLDIELLSMALPVSLLGAAAFSLLAEFSVLVAAGLQAVMLAAASAAIETRARVRTGVMDFVSFCDAW